MIQEEIFKLLKESSDITNEMVKMSSLLGSEDLVDKGLQLILDERKTSAFVINQVRLYWSNEEIMEAFLEKTRMMVSKKRYNLEKVKERLANI